MAEDKIISPKKISENSKHNLMGFKCLLTIYDGGDNYNRDEFRVNLISTKSFCSNFTKNFKHSNSKNS
jgi:hypothetical protein